MRLWPFGRKAPTAPSADDPALQRLQAGFECPCCGEWIDDIMDLAASRPDNWPHGEEVEPNAALRMDGDFLSSDFCVIGGELFMIRCVMQFPVDGLERLWTFGCWSSLSRENFEKYVDSFDSGDCPDEDPWFGWLCNEIKPHLVCDEDVPLNVVPQPGNQRPLLYAHERDNPFARAQSDGLTLKDLLAIFEANGHGPRLH